MSGQTQALAGVTEWYPGVLAPARVGVYQVQDQTMRCDCCWFEAYWTGKAWRCQTHSKGFFRTWMPYGVRRWRGLSAPVLQTNPSAA